MSFSIPTWLKQDDDLMLGDRPGSSDWFALSDEVGRGRTNHRRDVIKVESLLNQAGLFDLERLDGPWGYANERLDAPIKEYQKRNSLKVDGFLRPDGETINRFRQDYGDIFSNFPAPTPAMADAHHALREKGEDGLLIDRWPELKINPHRRLDPLAAKAGFDEWNDSWVKHAASANGSFEGIPAELKKYVDQDPVRGIMQARDMTQRWDALRPGEGNKLARAMLQALGDKPEYQSAYLASEIPQGPPIGTPRADAAQRYAAMVEEGRAEHATDAQQVAQTPETIPAEPPTQIAMGPGTVPGPVAPIPPFPDFTKLADEDLQAILRQSDRDLKEIDIKIEESRARLGNAADEVKNVNDGFVDGIPAAAASGATSDTIQEPMLQGIGARIAAGAVRGAVAGAPLTVPGMLGGAAIGAGTAAVFENMKKDVNLAKPLEEENRAKFELRRLEGERKAYDQWLAKIQQELAKRNEIVRDAISRGA